MINELITAFVFGIIGGMMPGPILAAIFTEILLSGFLKSFRVILIAFFIESIVALVSLLVLSSLNITEAVFRVISFIGAGILIWIASSIWKIKKINTGAKVNFGFLKISAMILANGVFWMFWITIFVPKAIILGNQLLFGEYLFFILVQLGWLISTIFFAFLFSRFRRLLLSPKIIPIIFKIFAIIFLYFALDMIYKSIAFFIN